MPVVLTYHISTPNHPHMCQRTVGVIAHVIITIV